MIYKDFNGEKLSALGMGGMRFPVIDGNDGNIDEEKTFELIDSCLEKGINYFDTAWAYHEGNSETVLGKALARHPRESYCLATKFPGYDLNNMKKVKEIFEKQLEKCGVDFFDFYLYHNVTERNIDAFLDPENGIHEYLMEMKAQGKIKHLGFSTHGELDCMKRFIEERGQDMEFCQIQLNYLDWEFQGAKEKVELLNEAGIPIWVMEPVRGGRLVSLGETFDAKLKELRPDEPVVNWAFRFLESVPGVTMVLSGMGTEEMLGSNVKIFSDPKPLSAEEQELLFNMCRKLTSKGTLPCTTCRYCTNHCPQGLEIPELIALYNEHLFTEGGFIVPFRTMAMPADKKPSACIGCQSCEAVCPQNIEIAKTMSQLVEFEEKFKKENNLE